MDQNNKLNEFIESTGVLAETCKIQYDAYINAGFSDYEAMFLVGKFVSAVAKAGLKNREDDD